MDVGGCVLGGVGGVFWIFVKGSWGFGFKESLGMILVALL